MKFLMKKGRMTSIINQIVDVNFFFKNLEYTKIMFVIKNKAKKQG